MAKREGLEALYSVRPTGAFGNYSAWLRGDITYADALLRTPMAGIYQVRRYGAKRVLVQEKFYRPTNPQTAPQQAWRAVFSAGKAAWDVLTSDEKLALNKRARPLKMSGFNLFMREYLLSHG